MNVHEILDLLSVLNVAVWFLCASIVTILTIAFCVNSIKFFGNVKQLMKNRLWILSFVTMILTCIEFSSMILTFYAIINRETAYITGFISFVIMFALFYFTLVFRVYITFKQTPQYSLSTSTITAIGCSILVTTCAIFSVYWKFGVNSKFNWIMLLSTYVGIIGLNILILYLFLRRFYQMILDMDQAFQRLMIDSNMNDDIDTNNIDDQLRRNQTRQMEIVDLMTKITLLTIIEQLLFFVWTLCGLIQYVLHYQLGYPTQSNLYSIFRGIDPIFEMLDICFICVALYFTFVFNHKQYQFCCARCHKQFRHCCVRCVVKKTLRYRVQNVPIAG